MSTLGISMLYDRWFIWYKISQWGLGIGTGTICYLEQNDILTTPFFDQLQGTQIIDDSHDQDTTDLNKCIAFITRNPPGPDNSNVQQISYQCLLQISVCNTSLYRCYSVFFTAVLHSSPRCAWRKVRSWDGEHQRTVSLLKCQDRPPVRRLLDLPAPKDAQARDPHRAVGRGSSLRTDPHGCAVKQQQHHRSPVEPRYRNLS